MGQNGREDDGDTRRKRTPSLPSHESIIQRSAQNQRWWKIVNTLCADQETIRTVFRTITSINQLSLYGAVTEMCEEYESYHDRTGGPVVRGQSSSSFVPSVMKTNMPLKDDDPTHKEFLLQRCKERIEKLTQQNRLSKICTNARFLTTVEIGQYFMTKDTEEFSQLTDSVACREYTLPRDEDSSEPKGWIKGNTKIWPVLEVATCYLHGKHGVEVRIKSVNRQFSPLGQSFSWLDSIGHELEQQGPRRQRAGNLRNAVRRICVKN